MKECLTERDQKIFQAVKGFMNSKGKCSRKEKPFSRQYPLFDCKKGRSQRIRKSFMIFLILCLTVRAAAVEFCNMKITRSIQYENSKSLAGACLSARKIALLVSVHIPGHLFERGLDMRTKQKTKKIDYGKEAVEYNLKKVEEAIGLLMPPFQKFILEKALSAIPKKMKEYNLEERHQKAVDNLVNMFYNWPTKKINETRIILQKLEAKRKPQSVK